MHNSNNVNNNKNELERQDIIDTEITTYFKQIQY